MNSIRVWFARLIGSFNKARSDRELADEIDSHVQLHIEDNLRSGMTPGAARRDALIKLGATEPLKEEYRDCRGVPRLETLAQDLRYGGRALRKNPAFTITAVLTLALGIGANTAVFSFVNSILLRPLPYSDPERLVQVKEHDRTKGVDFDWASFPNFHDWKEQNHVFEKMAAYTYVLLNLTGGDQPQTLLGLKVSADLLPLLGTRPILGRIILPEEDQPERHHVVVLSYDLWKRAFAQSPDAIGRSLTLDDESYTVVGVMPPDFNFPPTVPVSSMLPSRKMSFWVPLGFALNPAQRDWQMLGVVARLKPGASLASARAEMDTIAQRLEQQYPVQDSGVGVHIQGLRDQVVRDVRPAILVFLAAISLVLLIACANIANLQAARSTTRQKEIAVRIAIGASRPRIVRQLLTESLLLALFGGGLGVPIALTVMKILRVMIPGNLPRLAEVSFDARVLAYTFGISLLTGFIFGLAPALGASSLNLSQSLKGDGLRSTAGDRSSRLRSALVVTEVALSMAVLIGAGLMFKSFLRLQQVDPGFQPDNVLTAWTTLNGTKYRQPAEAAAFYRNVLERVESLPGVEAAGAVDALPLTSLHPGGPFSIEGRPTDLDVEAPFAYRCIVSPDYFRTMGIQLIRGRVFTETDRAGALGVVMINDSAAREYWPGDDPVGNRLSFTVGNTPPTWLEIVGVAGDVRQDGLDVRVKPTIYLPMLQVPKGFAFLVVRAAQAQPENQHAREYPRAPDLTAAIRAAIAAVDSDQPIFSVRAMSDIYGDALAGRRFNMLILAAFGTLALLLAGIGIYGLIAYAVTNRGQEIGVRVALGARPRQILTLIIRQGLSLTLAGIAFGLGGALILARFMSSLLFQVQSSDPATLGVVALVLTSVALLASYIPARRAMRLDPAIALRSA
jgi:predicted permease